MASFQDGSTQSHLCDLGQSPHQLVYNLYTAIALAEVKGYAMMQFSYMMLRLYGRGNFTLESDLARRTFETQAGEKLLAAKAVLEGLSRDYYRCDPPKHVEGKTYVQMTQLLQVCGVLTQISVGCFIAACFTAEDRSCVKLHASETMSDEFRMQRIPRSAVSIRIRSLFG
jgi:hypothetical protein